MSIWSSGFVTDLGHGASAGIVLAAYDGGLGGHASPGHYRWERVHMGFVSAYLFERGGEAVLVDTGTPRNEDNIARVVAAMGLSWRHVGQVIVTHHHPDHQGSLVAVLELASNATAYAGTLDIPRISSPRPLVAVGDGDSVMGLQIIDTPGHTPGHISVLDPGRVLIAGDAMVGAGGTAAGPDPGFTPDMAAGWTSVRKLAGFAFDAVAFGHGEPVLEGASAAVSALAQSSGS